MAKVKICGITNAQDALWAANLGVDFLGLNFYSQSPRKVSVKHAKELLAQIPPFIKSVGLFVDEPLESLQKTVKATGLKWVQLHGSETPEYAKQVKAGLDCDSLRAVTIHEASVVHTRGNGSCGRGSREGGAARHLQAL